MVAINIMITMMITINKMITITILSLNHDDTDYSWINWLSWSLGLLSWPETSQLIDLLIDWWCQRQILYNWQPIDWLIDWLPEPETLKCIDWLIGFEPTSQVFSLLPASVRAPFLRRENALLNDWRSCKEYHHDHHGHSQKTHWLILSISCWFRLISANMSTSPSW